MLSTFYVTVRQLVLPPTSLLLVLFVALLLAWRHRKVGLGLAWISAVVLALAGMPVIGRLLHQASMPAYEMPDPSMLACEAIVVPGGGIDPDVRLHQLGYGLSHASLLRVAMAIDFARSAGLPLVMAGGRTTPLPMTEAAVMADLAAVVLPGAVIRREERSRTTWENAEYVHALLAPEGIDRICLVSDPLHLNRAAYAFNAAGFTSVVPIPTTTMASVDSNPKDFLPSAKGLGLTSRVLHEWIGMLFYRIKAALE